MAFSFSCWETLLICRGRLDYSTGGAGLPNIGFGARCVCLSGNLLPMRGPKEQALKDFCGGYIVSHSCSAAKHVHPGHHGNGDGLDSF